MVVTRAIRVGGDEFDESIIKYVRDKRNLIIGQSTAEEIKISIGNVLPDDKIEKKEVKGVDTITGLPRRIELDSVEVRDSLLSSVDLILEEIKKTLAATPPELAADIIERGIVLTGGGALLKGFGQYISNQTKVPVIVAEDPLLCVAKGAGMYFEILNSKYGDSGLYNDF